MQITIRLLANYRQYLPDSRNGGPGYERQVAPGASVADLLAELPIPTTEVYTFFVNGRHAERDRALEDGDVLSIFPAAGGG
jgi:sulfur carrier protein ThiS